MGSCRTLAHGRDGGSFHTDARQYALKSSLWSFDMGMQGRAPALGLSGFLAASHADGIQSSRNRFAHLGQVSRAALQSSGCRGSSPLPGPSFTWRFTGHEGDGRQ